jgi:hypothetical protein
MAYRREYLPILCALVVTVASTAFAQERGGIEIPERVLEYSVPPSNGGGGGRPGIRLGAGADVQFGGPRFDFSPPSPQPLYRADNLIDGVGETFDVPPSTGGGGGRPAASDDNPYDYEYDAPDYTEDCGHPWHGACGPSPTWPTPFTAEELRRIDLRADW